MDKTKKAASIRRWRLRNPDKYRSIKRVCFRNRQERDKLLALSKYGKGGKAICYWHGCRVSDPDMLTLDHIQDDGAKDRRQNKGSMGVWLYARLRKTGWPQGYQTLCSNHQLKKELLRRRRARI